jgi:protein involved in polysaccharide export with SLBB domain
MRDGRLPPAFWPLATDSQQERRSPHQSAMKKLSFPRILFVWLLVLVASAVTVTAQTVSQPTPAAVDDQVALSADKIIEILSRQPGLMLQVKRVLVQKAYDQGRLLEEKDLTDDALYRLIQTDFNVRVLATKEIERRHYVAALPGSARGEVPRSERMRRETVGPEAGAPPVDSQQPNADVLQQRRVRQMQQQRQWEQEEQQQDQMQRISPAELPGILTASGTSDSGDDGAMLAAYAGSGSLPSSKDELTETDSPGTFGQAPAVKAAPANTAPAPQPATNAAERKVGPYENVPSLYDLYAQAAPQTGPPQRFGVDVFNNLTGNVDQLPMDVPAGPDYVVGPGDGLNIEVWGGVTRHLKKTVDREGKLNLPDVGVVQVAGRSLAQVQQQVQGLMSTEFRDVSSDVSIGRLRSLRVYVVGEVTRPGAYDVSSLSTPLNAIYTAGGPTPHGSLRAVKHYRGKQLIEEVDLYDLILRGVHGDVQRLQAGDSILVPPIGEQVTVQGMVRRPAIYELHGEKNLADVLALAGGVLPTGTLSRVEVERLVAHQGRSMLSLEIPKNGGDEGVNKALADFKIQDGDSVRISPILPYSEKTVYLDGHVFRGGKFSYSPGMRVSDLIKSYQELLPEPAPHYAEIIRLNPPDYRPTVIAFNLERALAHEESANLQLQPYDTVRIFGRYDFEDPPLITVSGDVRNPGEHRTSGQLRVRDAVYLAGGLSPDAALESAQIVRKVQGGQVRIFSVNLGRALGGDPSQNIALASHDRLIIHRNADYVDPPAVFIGGEVMNPGKYQLGEGMTASELVRLAGGFKRSADTAKADLTNYVVRGGDGTTGELQEVNIAQAMDDPSADVPLKDGDTLTIRQISGWKDLGASVTLRGEILNPSTYGIRNGERLSTLIERAGGMTTDAYPQAIIVERAQLREMEEKNRMELIRRLTEEQQTFQVAPGNQAGDAGLVRAAFAQQQSAIVTKLKAAPALGRMVVKINGDMKKWRGSSNDIELRAGDVVTIPKRPNYVVVSGQVFNPTAVTFHQGRNARWYLKQAGGATDLGDKKEIFVIRADGSVIGQGGGTGWWRQDPLDVALNPGDTVVVPERLINVPGAKLKSLADAAQIISSVAIAASVALK